MVTQSRAAVHLVLEDADPSGMVIATRDNWTGKAVSLPVGTLYRLKEAFTGAGVYVLIGSDEVSGDEIVYVGEAEDVRSRLNNNAHGQLKRSSDGEVTWHRAVIFVSEGGDLHKAHIKWLESTLVERARSTKRTRLENGNVPNKPKLPDFDQVFVETFLQNMLVLYPLLGVAAFTELPTQAASHNQTSDPGVPDPPPSLEPVSMKYYGEYVATGTLTPSDTIILNPGSRLLKEEAKYMSAAVRASRAHLASVDALDDAGEWWELNTAYEAASPSRAASMVTGKNENGRQMWTVDSTGQTVGEYQDARSKPKDPVQT